MNNVVFKLYMWEYKVMNKSKQINKKGKILIYLKKRIK